ncbi:hypothetical protein [Autumnicola psychrophila]|uniref:Uncharacterized protein n=1 Tax=Autumnicola psychrophila TaxID=3075592 RepID=A0ABU3DPD2_9FLAO|nr:hypothetical protein [Zunongwangia sp. F225]MDT0685568.1 hypothetical protein [Zunongwangia sp. F225]
MNYLSDLKPPKPEKIEIPSELTQVEEERQVFIHGYINSWKNTVRIHPKTYIICKQTGKKIKLLHFYNIAAYPQWTEIIKYEKFTLVFSGLPKECKSFDFLEKLNEPNIFERYDITRNESDVYTLFF